MALYKPEKNTKENVMCSHHHFTTRNQRSNLNTQQNSSLQSQSPPSIVLNGGNRALLNGLHLTCLLLGILNTRPNNAPPPAMGPSSRPQSSQPSNYSPRSASHSNTLSNNTFSTTCSSKSPCEPNRGLCVNCETNHVQSKTL